MGDLFSASGNTFKVGVGEYDPAITEEIDRQIRHMQPVLLRMSEKARELQQRTGSPNFELVQPINPGGQRPRSYVVPANYEGIHEELADAVLLKAALGMSGQ
jgi:hypothetical protein